MMIPDGMAVSLSVQAVVALTQLPQWPLVFVADESWMEQFWDTLWMLPLWGAGLYMGLGVWMYWHPFVFLGIMAVLLTWAQLHERRMRRKDERQRAEHAKAGQTHGGQSQVGQSQVGQSRQMPAQALTGQAPTDGYREPCRSPHGEPPHGGPPHEGPSRPSRR